MTLTENFAVSFSSISCSSSRLSVSSFSTRILGFVCLRNISVTSESVTLFPDVTQTHLTEAVLRLLVKVEFVTLFLVHVYVKVSFTSKFVLDPPA